MNDNATTLPPARKRRGLVIAVVISAVLLGGLFASRVVATRKKQSTDTATAATPPQTVAVAAVVRADVPNIVVFTGAVRPKAEVDVFAKGPGKVESVSVDVGTQVKAGQLLAVVEHNAQALQAQQAHAQVEAAEAGLEQATVAAESAAVSFKRTTELRAANAIPQAEFERAEAQFKASQVQVRTAKAQVSLAQAGAGLAGRSVADTRITTPITGVVVKRNVDVGNQATPQAPLFQIQDTTALTVDGTVSAQDALALQLGAPAQVTVDELPGEAFEAKVKSLSPSLDPQTRRAAIEIEIEGGKRLLPNMFAKVQLAVGASKNALVIPAAAVITLATGKVVYVAAKDGTAQSTSPQLGAEIDGLVVVESGLVLGQQVIISGDAGLRPGAQIIVATAAKTPTGAAGETAQKDGAK